MSTRIIFNTVHTAQFWEMEVLGEGLYRAQVDEYLVVVDKNHQSFAYRFPEGTVTDFASVPKLAERFLGLSPLGKQAMAAAIHDYHYSGTASLQSDLGVTIASGFQLTKWGFKVPMSFLTSTLMSPTPKALRKFADIVYLNNMRHLGTSILSRYTRYLAVRLFGARYFTKATNS